MGFSRDIPQLIQAIGSPGFVPILFNAVRQELACEQMIVFVSTENVAPTTTLMVSRRPIGPRNKLYMSHYWRVDPMLRRMQEDRSTGLVVVKQEADEIDDHSYRQVCYDQLSYTSRLTLYRREDKCQLRTNFYFAQGQFQERGCAQFLQNSFPVVSALLAKHGAYQRQHRNRLTYGDAVDLIRARIADLRPREVQVAAGIACGMTSEAISLQLGIRINTVLTYRKRCYARMNISSQNELLHMVIGDERAHGATP